MFHNQRAAVVALVLFVAFPLVGVAVKGVSIMGLAELAGKAVRWLLVGVRSMRKNREVTRALLKGFVVSEKIQARVEAFFAKTAKVEAKWGVHADFWRKVKAAKKAGTGCELTPEDVRYIHYFKAGFDDTLKPIGKKIVAQMGLDGVDDDGSHVPLPGIEVPELTPGEANDDNLDLGSGFVDPTKGMASG